MTASLCAPFLNPIQLPLISMYPVIANSMNNSESVSLFLHAIELPLFSMYPVTASDTNDSKSLSLFTTCNRVTPLHSVPRYSE